MQIWKTTESDDCRGVSERDGDANGILAAMREGADFPAKIKTEVY